MYLYLYFLLGIPRGSWGGPSPLGGKYRERNDEYVGYGEILINVVIDIERKIRFNNYKIYGIFYKKIV